MKRSWFSFVAFVLALIAIILVCWHACIPVENWEGSKDYIGMLITLLGTIIVFVVGFQIYNAADFKDRLKKLEEEKKDFEKIKEELKTAKDDFNRELDEARNEMYEMRGNIESYQAVSRISEGKYLISISHSFENLYYSLKCNNSEMSDVAILNVLAALGGWKGYRVDQFDDNISVNGKSIEDAIFERIMDIEDEFRDKDIYTRNKSQLLEIKTRLEQKVQEHKTKQAPKNTP